jgi:hypothetical protein
VRLAAALVACAAVLASSAVASVPSGFSVSRSGGNIIPFQARISPSGHVVVNKEQRAVLTSARLAGLQRLVDRERFASLPARIACAGALPDIATRSVTATSHGTRKTVSAHGGCNGRFDRVYSALARAVGQG